MENQKLIEEIKENVIKNLEHTIIMNYKIEQVLKEFGDVK